MTDSVAVRTRLSLYNGAKTCDGNEWVSDACMREAWTRARTRTRDEDERTSETRDSYNASERDAKKVRENAIGRESASTF